MQQNWIPINDKSSQKTRNGKEHTELDKEQLQKNLPEYLFNGKTNKQNPKKLGYFPTKIMSISSPIISVQHCTENPCYCDKIRNEIEFMDYEEIHRIYRL